MPAAQRTGGLTRVAGLDTLRFLAAFSVVISHELGEPPVFHWAGIDPTLGFLKIVQGIYWKFFFTGISGVMVFFIISGLCIHLPNARGLQIRCLKSYFTRRLLRILPPTVPIVLFYHYVDGMTVGKAVTGTILWSVVCEVIYYLIYPLLLAMRRRLRSWWVLVGIAYAAGICVVLTDPGSTSYWSYGPWLTWIIGLSCWLLGAALAEIIGNPVQPSVTLKSIWAWRLSAWSLAALCVALKFRVPLGDPWTMDLYAIFAFFWIHREIIHYQTATPNRILETLGTWSFSIYITHRIFAEFWRDYWKITKPFGPVDYFGSAVAILLTAYVYYRAVELPTHKFSRFAADWLKRGFVRSSPEMISKP